MAQGTGMKCMQLQTDNDPQLPVVITILTMQTLAVLGMQGPGRRKFLCILRQPLATILPQMFWSSMPAIHWPGSSCPHGSECCAWGKPV